METLIDYWPLFVLAATLVASIVTFIVLLDRLGRCDHEYECCGKYCRKK